jgi:hypothetical protein
MHADMAKGWLAAGFTQRIADKAKKLAANYYESKRIREQFVFIREIRG